MPMPQFPPQPPVDLALSPVQELLVVIKVCVHSWILGILCHVDCFSSCFSSTGSLHGTFQDHVWQS